MLATMLMGLVLAAQAPAAKAQEKGAAQEAPADSPERAIRAFIVAILTKDVPALRAVTLPADDLEAILPPQSVPPGDVEALRAHVAGLPVRLLKAGEEVELGGGTYKARPEDVGPDSAVVLPDGASFPLVSRKVQGRWRIDAAPLVANAKAAARPDPAPGPAPKTIDPAPIKDKVAIKLGQKLDVRFTRQGDALSAPKAVAAPEAEPEGKAEAVRFEFTKTDENLMLVTQNPFAKNLVFRAAARYRGREAYVETSIVPVRAGIFGIEMWRDPIEELILFDFKLVDPAP